MPNYLKRGTYRSLILHAALIVGFPLLALVYRWTGLSSEQDAKLKALQMAKTAIRVDMVDLPSLKLSEMQNVDLTKEVDDSNKAAEDALAQKRFLKPPCSIALAKQKKKRNLKKPISKRERSKNS